jgi:hypothetical protein
MKTTNIKEETWQQYNLTSWHHFVDDSSSCLKVDGITNTSFLYDYVSLCIGLSIAMYEQIH